MIRILTAAPESTVDSLIKETERKKLESLGAVEWHHDLNRETSEDEYSNVLSKTRPEILITGWGSPLLTGRLYRENPQLKYLLNLTGELKKYVARECLEQGLIVTNWGDIPAASVAEAALMMTLASLRQAYYWQKCLHEEKAWPPRDPDRVPRGLFDKTVGLYGFGMIARKFLEMIRPFHTRVLVFSSWLTQEDKEAYNIETTDSLESLFEQSDIISIHTGRRPDTYHSVNARVLGAMKDGGHIVNTARGAIIDTDALVEELRRGRLFAALDVFETEPLPPDHPLRGLDRCLLFPHHGGPTPDYRYRCGINAVNQIELYIRREPLKYRLSPEQYDRIT